MIKELKIPEDNFEKFEKRVKKLNKLSMKLNLTPIEYKIVGEHFEKIKIDESNPLQIAFCHDSQIIVIKILEIELTGELPQIPNWEFVGVIEHQEEMNIIKKMSDIEIDKKYYKSGCTCDHCKTNRLRKTTILVKNSLTNEFKQVGKSCLHDYLGHNALECFEWINEVNCLDEFDNTYIRDSKYYDIKGVLLMTLVHLKTNEFISGKVARELVKDSTADKIFENYYRFNYNQVNEDDREEVNKIISYVKNLELSNNDYINNLITLVNNRYFHLKNWGYVVSIVNFYKREMAKIKEKELNKNNNSNFVGNIKGKIETELIYLNCFSYETQWGTSHIFKFADDKSNIYIWSTNKGLNYSNGFSVNEGDKIRIKGTIKEHKEYKGEKQTYITRCKIA